MPIQFPQMDPLPLPDNTPVKQEENRQAQNMQNVQQVPRGAGFASTPAKYAYIANNILTGWMAGRHTAEERKLNQAKQQVTSSKSVYDTLAQTYSDQISAGKSKDDPEMKKMAGDVTTAWNNYLNVAQKYSSPDDGGKDGKKKTAGQKVKGAASKFFGMDVDPKMFLSGSLNILRQSGPPVLKQEMSPQDKEAQLRIKGEETALEAQTKEIKEKSRWGELAKIDPAKRTPDQQKEMEGLEREMFPKTVEQQTKDDLLKKVLGGTKLNDSEKELAENMGILRHKQTSSITRVNGKGEDEIVTLGEEGTVLATRNLGKHNWGPDQVATAQRMLQMQIDIAAKQFKKMHQGEYSDPIALDKDASKFATMVIPGFRYAGGDPVRAERQMFEVSDAIKQVMSEVPKGERELFKNFIVDPDDAINGIYAYRTGVVDPQGEKTHWFSPNEKTYYGGLSKEELASQEQLFRQRLLTALQKKNPKATPDQINSMMPPPVYSGRQMSAAPGSSQSSREMSDTPKFGGNHYKMVAPDGSTVAEDVTEEEMEILKKDPKMRGVTFDNLTGSGAYNSQQMTPAPAANF